MGDDNLTPEQRMDELRITGEVMGKLASDPKLFAEAVEAFRSEDAGRWQAVLERAGLYQHCHVICRFLCSKHCLFICDQLAGPHELMKELDVEEWRQFSVFTARIAADEQLLNGLVAAVDSVDQKAFQEILKKLDALRFAHQLCHWLCRVRCRRVCRVLCPPPPLITAVGLISSGQIPANGLAAGPSFPPGPTPPDSKSPGGVGDHPFGGLANIKGAFNTLGAVEYKVEYTPAGGGPPTAITTGVQDFKLNPGFPPPPLYLYYTRVPTGDWYAIADMGLLGQDYLTDWVTKAIPDGEYDLRLTVRTAALVERHSPVVRVVVDNTRPSGPGPGGTPMMTISQGDQKLPCCGTVKREGGPLTIHIEGEDEHFSQMSVTAYGSCNVAVAIFAKTYDGNLAERGAPAPGMDITWDPWADGAERCCYVVFFRIYDRAILGNAWSIGNNPGETWQSVTIS